MSAISLPERPACQLELGTVVWQAFEADGEIVTIRLVCGKPEAPVQVTAGFPKRTGERWSRPHLTVGPDGVPWLFYLSEVRRMTFYHRWLGEGWGQRFDGRGVFHAEPLEDNSFDENLMPISRFEVSGAEGAPVALTLATAQYPYKEVIHSIDAPHPKAQPGAGELFLDTQAVAFVQGLTWAMETARKHPANPILEPTFQPGTPDEGGAMQHGTVIFDNGRFRMWYTGWEIPGHGDVPLERNWDHYVHVCYAESGDGIHWERVNLGLVEYMGKRNNNLVPSLWLRPVIMRDDLEPDPQRRYKCWEQTWPWVSYPGRAQLHISPDGIHWSTEESPRAMPGTRPHWFGWDTILRDETDPDPEQRWKAYGYFAAAPLRRTAGYAFSRDGIRWTCYAENPIIDPLQGVRTACHDFIVWRERGLYLGLLQVGDVSTRDDYDFELVVSRDGLHFSRVADGRSFLQHGADGDWDPGMLCVFHNGPVFVGDEAWFYYGAKSFRAGKKFDVNELMAEWHQTPTRGGLALIKTGRYAGFSVSDGRASGELLTTPIAVAAGRRLGLRLNADCARGGEIRAGIERCPAGQPLPSYSVGECDPIAADDVAVPVSWGGRGTVEFAQDETIRLRLRLSGNAKVYGFEWVA